MDSRARIVTESTIVSPDMAAGLFLRALQSNRTLRVEEQAYNIAIAPDQE